MAIARYNDFTGTNGAAWPAGWTTSVGSSIQGNRGRVVMNADWGAGTAHTTGLNIANVRMTGRLWFNSPNAARWALCAVRHNGLYQGATIDTGFEMLFGTDNNTVTLAFRVGGVETPLATVPYTWPAVGTELRFTLEAIEGSGSTTVRGKIWAAANWSQEDAPWTIEATTSAPNRPVSGGCEYNFTTGLVANVVEVDDVIIQNMSDSRIRVLPVGDSITSGAWNAGPTTYTYRKYLYDTFAVSATPLQMVGRNWAAGGADTNNNGALTVYAGLGTWEHNHLSRNGWTVNQVAAYAGLDTTAYNPDVAVIYIGLNDIFAQDSTATIVSRVQTLIGTLRAAKSNIKIALCQVAPLAPGHADAADVAPYNAALATMAAAQTNSTSPIMLADCYTGFNTAWLDPSDGTHTLPAGDQFIASRVGPTITALLATDAGWAVFADGTSTATSAIVTGLTNGTNYEFRVRAVNAIGNGAYSNIDDAIPAGSSTAPGAPTGLVAVGTNGQVSLMWSAPASNGGSPITDYVVQWRTTAGPGSWNTFSDGVGTGTTAVVTGLTNGTSYDFQVAAVNAVGTSAYSAIDTEAPVASIPGAPTSLLSTAGNAQVSLSWTAPSSNGGSAITDYVVQYKLSSSGTWSTFADGTSTGTTATVTGLANGSPYDFRIAAVNAVGTGPYTAVDTETPVAPATVPGAPTGLTPTAGNAQVSLAWTAPASNGGSALTDYIVQYKATSSGTWLTFADGTSTATTAVVTGLTNATSYDFRVAAVNAIGTGANSTTATATPVAPPTTITPTDLANLFIWLDASDASTFTYSSGSTVTTWRDKSGNSHHFFHDQGSPTRVGTQNGLAVVDFLNARMYPNGTAAGGVATGATSQPVTVFVVARLENTTWGGVISGSTGSPQMRRWGSTGTDVSFDAGTAVQTPMNNSGFHVLSAVYNGASSIQRIDQADAGISNTGTGTWPGTYPKLGSDNDNNPMDGQIAEVIIYKRALTRTEIANVEIYLSMKWFGSVIQPSTFSDPFDGTGALGPNWTPTGLNAPTGKTSGEVILPDNGWILLSGVPCATNKQFAQVTKRSAGTVALLVTSPTRQYTFPWPDGYVIVSRNDGVYEAFRNGASLGYTFGTAAPIGTVIRAEHDGIGNLRLLHDGVQVWNWDDPGVALVGTNIWVGQNVTIDNFSGGDF